ncbi:hypothetical protein ABER02_07835 [Rossellomorea marisflavi]|uniref:hypothetical protein n=1 Tax=Rossellomorea marisflavi TaxID=189381 RepID=UPI00135A2196
MLGLAWLYTFLAIWFFAFVIARLLSRFGRTHWKDELMITCAQAIIITAMLDFFLP